MILQYQEILFIFVDKNIFKTKKKHFDYPVTNTE